MFKSIITSTPFTLDTANDFFNNINGDTYYRDVSFLSTLRALVAPRMTNDDHLYVAFQQTSNSRNEIDSSDPAYSVRCAVYKCEEDFTNTIVVHNFTGSAEDNQAWMGCARTSFCDVYSGWHPLEKVTLFFKKQFDVLCFVNPEIRGVMLFADNMDLRKMHYLQCGIFAFLPWYFNPDDGVSETEMELINSLREKTSEKYLECLDRMAEKYDFKTAKIRKLLAGFETKYEQLEIDNIRNKIDREILQIEGLNSQIANCLRAKRDYEVMLLGLETKIAQDGETSEIMEYFLCNNKLVLESVNNTTMVFGVTDYLTYFDEDMAERMINNEASYIYRPNGRPCNNIIPAEDMKKLMTAILIDQTLRIRLCAAYSFELDGRVMAKIGFSYGSAYRDCTPNTHIDRYGCLGNYERQINSFLSNHDSISAIEQCVASCKSLNLGDAPVMQEFMRRLYGISDYSVNTKCIELPDGSVVHAKEAIEYLKQEETKNG